MTTRKKEEEEKEEEIVITTTKTRSPLHSVTHLFFSFSLRSTLKEMV